MILLKFVGNQNAHVGLGTTTSITQETSAQYLTLFDGTAAIEKQNREVICKCHSIAPHCI
jgi:hypothetical protein